MERRYRVKVTAFGWYNPRLAFHLAGKNTLLAKYGRSLIRKVNSVYSNIVTWLWMRLNPYSCMTGSYLPPSNICSITFVI